MDNRLIELECDVRIAQARADLAITLLRALVRELSGGVVDWNEADLFRSTLPGVGDDPAARLACLDLINFGDEELRPGRAYIADQQRREMLRDELWEKVRHDRSLSSGLGTR